ncbi:MAG: hypothetical protein H6710_14720 [Myxococcales bacterium]|nr:hypothetical protein [Myxococcales bacterium]MCB9702072.1 hypothetical protein [Myxococcales bacterium]
MDAGGPETPPGGWGEALDRLGEAVFGGPGGHARAAGLLAEIDGIVGGLSLGDQPHELLQAHRVDWALCEMLAPGGGPGETWAWRAAQGIVPGIEATPVVAALATSVVGLFEVWRARGALILRERLSGIVTHLAAGEGPLEIEGELGLWETRLVLTEGGARLCRPPLAYPPAILPWLERATEQRWGGEMSVDLLDLRAMRLAWARAGAGDPRPFFRGHGG